MRCIYCSSILYVSDDHGTEECDCEGSKLKALYDRSVQECENLKVMVRYWSAKAGGEK